MSELIQAQQNPQVVTQIGGGDVMVIAEQPGEMQAAQQALIAWATEKVERVKIELADAEAAHDQAVACGVKMNGIRKLMGAAEEAVTYYEKVKAALEAGYCIVPDFPVEIVAIRTTREEPDHGVRESQGHWKPTIAHSCEVLPEGEGKYVSPNPVVQHIGQREEKEGAYTKTLSRWRASEFSAVGLPIKFMKPRVLEATQHALAAKVFDEIGILPAAPKKDPMIVGRIVDPKGKRLSFLISWFVDTRDL